VGRKTASIILNMVFGKMDIAVDTHIFRVANRTGLAPGKNPREVENALVANTPDEFKKNAHHWLLLHGRYVCTARKPACPKCIINDLCEYPQKTPAAELPKSDAPVAHKQAPPAIASRIEAALSAKASGQLDGKGTSRSARGAKAARSGSKGVARVVRKKGTRRRATESRG
jgi:adenine-specific DNA glycosylase